MIKNNEKLLFFDIDETLIPGGGDYPADTLAALKMAKERGHKLFINTGRVKCNVEDYIFNDLFSGIICGCGTHILYEGEELFYHPLSRNLCYETAKLCRECRMYGLFEYKDYSCYDGKMPKAGDNPLIGYFKKSGRKLVSDIESDEFIFDKFTIWYDDDSDTETFKRETAEHFNLIDRGDNFFEMEPLGFSKASGMKFLADYFGCKREDIFAFGDSTNDLAMLEFAGTGIAMGNASPFLKKMADYITDDINHGGIMNAMKHFELI